MSEQSIAELLKLRQQLQGKQESLTRQLDEVQKHLQSVLVTLSLLGYRESRNESQEEYIFPPAQVKGLTHHQALERIANANNGRFMLKDAVKVLVAGRLISNPKNGYNILFNTIKRIGLFRKGGPGEYVLPNRGEEKAIAS